MIKDLVLESFRDRSVLVTGGTGLIGRQVVDILCSAGANVTSVSMDNIKVDDRCVHLFKDLSYFDTCKRITEGRDYVFHLAGVKGSVEVTNLRPASFLVPLLMMNTNMLEACRVNNVQKVIYTSSIGAYSQAEVFKEENGNDGDPMDHFPGWAKRVAELQIKAYKIQYGLSNYSIVRPCNVYGPGDNFDTNNAMVIPSIMARVYKGEDPLVVWGDGSAVRDFAYSRDVAEGIILALYYGTGILPFVNLGSGKGITIKELVETMSSVIGFDFRFDGTKDSGHSKRVMNIQAAKELLGYSPSTDLADGIKLTWNWYKSHSEETCLRKNYFVEA
jgi:GDP-L-fucose synthase